MNLFFSYPSAIIKFSALLLFRISEKRVVSFDEALCIFRGSSTEASSIWFLSFALRKKCPYSKLFWSAFSLMRTEYGEMYSFRMRESANQKIPNTDTFHTVSRTLFTQYHISSHFREKYFLQRLTQIVFQYQQYQKTQTCLLMKNPWQ